MFRFSIVLFLTALLPVLQVYAASSFGTLTNDNFTRNGSATNGVGGETLIVGGSNANRYEFPWLVHITVDDGKRKSFCGGSLLKLDLVLTAAHCIGKYKSITVVAGDYHLNRNDGTEQTASGSRVKIHEKYDSTSLINDIALIRLSTKFTQTNAVQTVGLPPANREFTGWAVAAGWGATSEFDQAIHPVLQKVTIPIITNRTCTSQPGFNRNLQLCAGSYWKDSCQGDSGGGLICVITPRTVCGIVSWGVGCGRLDSPGVYTKVSAYVEWINKNSGFSSNVKAHALFTISPALILLLKKLSH